MRSRLGSLALFYIYIYIYMRGRLGSLALVKQPVLEKEKFWIKNLNNDVWRICGRLVNHSSAIVVYSSSDSFSIATTQYQRQTHEGKRRKTSLQIFTSHFIARFERVVQGLHVRGCWRPNINFIFWPLCYDRHVVSFLFSCCWGLLHWGFPRAPSVGCGLSYRIWSLAVWNSTGNCFGTPNSTELNNNSMPTRSPTGSLKSDV